jgi:PhnB protein
MGAERAVEVLLDDAVSALLAGRPLASAFALAHAEPGEARETGLRVGALIAVARDLKESPAAGFRRRLGEELARTARSGQTKETREKKEGGNMSTTVWERPKNEETDEDTESAARLQPYLVVRDAPAALEFYRQAFGATEVFRLTEPGGRIGHAEVRLGRAGWMLADEYPEYGTRAPSPSGATGVSMHLSVPDVDAFVARAEEAGATVTSRPHDEFYGDRASRLVDPFGHVWHVSTRKEIVSAEEMQRRYDEILAAPSPPAPSDAAPPPTPTRRAEADVTPAARPGFHAVTPYLQVRRPAELIDFLKAVFGAVETGRTTGSAGGMHAEVRIGDSMVMIGGMESLEKEMPAVIYLYLPDVDGAYERALAAGATSLLPPTDQPYGDRNAWVQDRFGNTWYLARHIG